MRLHQTTCASTERGTATKTYQTSTGVVEVLTASFYFETQFVMFQMLSTGAKVPVSPQGSAVCPDPA